MGYSNGQVQSSSDSGKAQKGDPGLPGIGFNLTDDGNFDLDGKRLTDVADPVDNGDAVTKGYVDTKNSQQNIAINSKAEKAYVDSENSTQDIAINSKADKNKVLLLDGSQSMNANLNMDNQKITNVANATDNDDAVNFSQLKSHTDSHLNNYHLQPSFTFYRNFGNQGKLPRSTRINLFPNHHHHGLNWVKKEGSDSGFNGQAWVSLKMTNNLPVGIYTVVFELFSGISSISGGVTQLDDETLITQVHGDANYKIITFSHDAQTTHSKAFIQFNSNGQAGEITFQIRYYGSSHNNPSLNFLFFSRVISGKIGTYFDHALLDVDDVQDKNQIIYFEDVNINDNKLKGLAAPSEDKDGANKKYVDDQIKAIPAVDTSDLLKLDGTRAMTGNLQMGDHIITGIRSSSADNAALTVGASKSLYLPISGIRGMQGNLNMSGQSIINLRPFVEIDSVQPAQDNEVINFGYFHTQRGDLKRLINEVASDALNRKSPDPMLDPIDMGNNFITNVKDPLPSNSRYAATVNFVNKTVSDNNTTISTLIDSKINEVEDLNIKAAKQENVFSFIMDDDLFKEDDSDITKVGKVNKDFYDIHKETFQFYIRYDSSIGYYSTRLGIDLKPLDLGEYTFVFEMYYDKNKVNKDLVVVEAQSVPLNIFKNTTKTFDNHSRTIINFNKPGNLNIIDLDIDITMKNKARIAYGPTTTIFVVVYGVSGYQNDVESRVWDRVYLIQNNTVLFEATIDMKKHDIKNVDNLSMNKLIDMNKGQIKDLGDGNENGDAVNVKQLNDVESNMGKYIKAEITKVDTSLKKYFNDHLNNAIAERGYQNSLICVFYLDDNQFNNGDKIADLPDKKSFTPIYDANQSVESRKPTADDDLNFSYMNYRAQQCLTVDYNLNGKNNLNVFIVFRILDSPGATLNGIFGNDNGGNDRYIAVLHNVTPKELRIGYGNGRLDLSSFPSKANPITLNFSVLSVHYNTPDENNSLVYCNGKYVINFTGETSTGQNTFSIGSISSDPIKDTSLKHIAYFSLYYGRFSAIDIKRQHRYLCERYKIDHDPITIP